MKTLCMSTLVFTFVWATAMSLPVETSLPDPITEHGVIDSCPLSCPTPPCADATGQCCPTCPNGPNCLMPNNEIIPDGGETTDDDGTVCMCVKGTQIYCLPPPLYVADPVYEVDPTNGTDPVYEVDPKYVVDLILESLAPKPCKGKSCKNSQKNNKTQKSKNDKKQGRKTESKLRKNKSS